MVVYSKLLPFPQWFFCLLSRHGWLLLVLAALVFRLLYFDHNPIALNVDEAINGYNAYSIALTGCDVQGFCGSTLAHGFGNVDYRGALYVYIAAPFIRLFGLSEVTTRLPALLLNFLLLLVVYRLVVLLTARRDIALLSIFWMVFNPWHFHFSRLGHEAAIAPFFYFLGIYLLVKGLRDRPALIIFSAVPFGLSLYVYQVAQVMTPLLIVATLIVYSSRLKRSWPYIIGAGVVLLVVVFPFVHDKLIYPGALEYREKDVTVFFLDQPVVEYLGNITSYLDAEFLFLNDTAVYHPSTINVGVFQSYMLVMLVVSIPGLVLYWHRAAKRRADLAYLVLLLLLTVLIAAVAEPSPDRLKAYTLYLVFYILVAIGIISLGDHLRLGGFSMRRLILGTVIVLEFFHAAVFLPNYYFEAPLMYEDYNQVGMKSVVDVVRKHESQVETIYFTYAANQPFIYLLFYLPYPPAQFISDDKEWNMRGFGWMYSFGKYRFVNDRRMAALSGNNLYVSVLRDLDKELIEVVHSATRCGKYYVYKDAPAES